MPLETLRGIVIVEDILERRIFEGSTVDIACHPVIIKHRGILNKVEIMGYSSQERVRELTSSAWNM